MIIVSYRFRDLVSNNLDNDNAINENGLVNNNELINLNYEKNKGVKT